MTSKTHIAAACALTTALLLPTSVKELAIFLASTTIGSITPDIDVSTSDSHKDLAKIITIFVTVILTCIAIEYYFNIGLLGLLLAQTKLYRIIIGLIAYFIIGAIGLHTSHRTFMHSIFCSAILAIIVFFIFPDAMIPFTIGMLSHIFLDLFNHKKIQLLFPLKFKIGLDLCSSNGKVDKLLYGLFFTISIIELILFITFQF